MQGRHVLIDSPQLGRPVHLWCYGWWGTPVLVFPSASGMAHEWQSQGMIDALAPWVNAGRLKLYCAESNVAEAWTRKEGSPAWRLARHEAYTRFVMEALVPWIRQDCRSPQIPLGVMGCSLGGMYAVSTALREPETFRWALGMSGRYDLRELTRGWDTEALYFHNPLAFVPGLRGQALERVRHHARIDLVCGQGAWEDGCIEETVALGKLLRAKGIQGETDIWGKDVEHGWAWWRRQVVLHIARRFGG